MADAKLEELIRRAAAKYGVPYAIARAVAIAESGINQNARSPAGAIGVMQLMPSTAKALGVNPYDAAQNIEGGVRYLRQLYDRFGRWDLAVAAYNAGPGAVEKYKGIPPYKETINYVRRVMSLAGEGGGQAYSASAARGQQAASRTTQAPDVDLRSMVENIKSALQKRAQEALEGIARLVKARNNAVNIRSQLPTPTVEVPPVRPLANFDLIRERHKGRVRSVYQNPPFRLRDTIEQPLTEGGL